MSSCPLLPQMHQARHSLLAFAHHAAAGGCQDPNHRSIRPEILPAACPDPPLRFFKGCSQAKGEPTTKSPHKPNKNKHLIPKGSYPGRTLTVRIGAFLRQFDQPARSRHRFRPEPFRPILTRAITPLAALLRPVLIMRSARSRSNWQQRFRPVCPPAPSKLTAATCANLCHLPRWKFPDRAANRKISGHATCSRYPVPFATIRIRADTDEGVPGGIDRASRQPHRAAG